MQKLLAEMYRTRLDMNVATYNYSETTISDCYLEYFQH